jgi:hypothetical protein
MASARAVFGGLEISLSEIAGIVASMSRRRRA